MYTSFDAHFSFEVKIQAQGSSRLLLWVIRGMQNTFLLFRWSLALRRQGLIEFCYYRLLPVLLALSFLLTAGHLQYLVIKKKKVERERDEEVREESLYFRNWESSSRRSISSFSSIAWTDRAAGHPKFPLWNELVRDLSNEVILTVCRNRIFNECLGSGWRIYHCREIGDVWPSSVDDTDVGSRKMTWFVSTRENDQQTGEIILRKEKRSAQTEVHAVLYCPDQWTVLHVVTFPFRALHHNRVCLFGIVLWGT